MGSTWFPPGWVLDVPNPGYGELDVAAPSTKFDGHPPVTKEDWSVKLHGGEIGKFLSLVTHRALESPLEDAEVAALPAFLTPPVARGLLPDLQMATVLAVAGSDLYDRTYLDPDAGPQEPYCIRCHKGTFYTPGELPSEWCDRHGHHAYGYSVDTSWETAQLVHSSKEEWWTTRREILGR